ncbi:hypothetical protein TVAG_392550 [Trichomonas vaginalis G3]|uniref:Uncharacterized protein n=1 Tax=Trichomonas vaginalis (strain ATCC PRA-98 / G3) TaxID=412133 RepID=A2DWV6_TRIV3|nr:hypothetical protein TVAGG3_0839320 [Trichomonas vaginalis G3]EAY15138.1 hypothetical protein TVAG_392550 [Trichomonas vaginalis G3]KAI5499170.1 hypothetical protein TVAGG3_0839320 [Trichomonas vaginalis G3]|eukprot:XP_001327361.1 hypothetical protein [Trichomonas vaginalis G3]
MDDLVVVNFLSKKRVVPSSQHYSKSVRDIARLNLSALEKEVNTSRNQPSGRRTQTSRPIKSYTSRSNQEGSQSSRPEKTKKEVQKFVDHHILENVIQTRHAEAIQADQEEQIHPNRFKIDRRNLPPEQRPSARPHFRYYYWG